MTQSADLAALVERLGDEANRLGLAGVQGTGEAG